MTCVSYADLRQNLARYMDEAVESRAPSVVTRQAGRGNVVMVSEDEFEGWRETVHLLSSPRNAARIFGAIRQLDAGQGRARTLIPAKDTAG
ncbi:MAG: type II toxin-antitoxin system prevent-host-death family antitoxin [Acetobacteraceae bacterium]|nr:type II toxin-antitoxin system prevent-host-death family antitoxin [Acetobacteraceae bacterium]